MTEATNTDWEAYAEEQGDTAPTPGANAKAVLEDQIKQLNEEDEAIAKLEEDLKQAKARRVKLVENIIPETFADMGLDDDSVIKVDGKAVTIKTTVYASPKAENRGKVYDWLEENGHGGLIKRTAIFKTGRDNEAKFRRWIKSITTYDGEFAKSVAPATLKAFVNEQLQAGTEIPMDLFGAYTRRIATVK